MGVCYAILTSSKDTAHPEVLRIATNLTLHTLKLNYSGTTQFIIGDRVDSLLSHAQSLGAEWCVLLRPGLLIRSRNFFVALENELKHLPIHASKISFGESIQASLCQCDSTSSIESPVSLDYVDLNINLEAPRLLDELKYIQTPEWGNDTTRSSRVSLSTVSALEYLHYQCRSYGNEMFVFNTENYLAIQGKNKRLTLDGLYSLASGFKDLFLLREHGVHKSTQVHYFDLCKQTLLLKKYMLENWDGRNFPTMLQQFMNKFSTELTTVVPALELDKLTLEWKNELERWGGEAEFTAAFQQVKPLRHTFTQVDIIKNPTAVGEMLAKATGNNFAVWYSNCFTFTPALAKFNWDLIWIEAQGNQFLSAIHEISLTGKHVVLYGPHIISQGKSERSTRLASEIKPN